MNDGDIPAERYDFSGFSSFKGNFDVVSYLKYGIHDMVFELINQIRDEEFNYDKLKDIVYEDFKRLQITY